MENLMKKVHAGEQTLIAAELDPEKGIEVCAPEEWVKKNLTNKQWWTEKHYWNISCDTCEHNLNGICAGGYYGKPVSEIKKDRPNGCQEWGIDLDNFSRDDRLLRAAGATLDWDW
ncbi:MAG: hypothetical protein ACI3U8_03140 [Candidatus Onthomonas sp.]